MPSIYEQTQAQQLPQETVMSERFTRLLNLIDEAVKANPGYDQGQRWTWLDKENKRIIPGMEADCSAMTMGLVWLAGYSIPDANIGGRLTCYTGNEPQLMALAGWHSHASLGLSVTQIDRMTTAGDVILGDGHTMIKHRSGLWWSMNQDENGNGIGGRRGDQTGYESSLRPLWARHGGWIAFYTAPDKDLSAVTAAGPSFSSPAQSLSKFLDTQTVEALQKVTGTVVDGIAGPNTTKALEIKAGYAADGRLDTPSSTVKTVQKYLNQFVGAGWCTYGHLDADGVLGPKTAAALRNYLLQGHGALKGLAAVKL